MKISHLAYYIIEKHSAVDGGITPLKLQKLLYYCKVWGIVSGELTLSGQFTAWKNGPVNGFIYNKYKEYGNKPIPFEEAAYPISSSKETFIDFVLESYVHFDALTLSAMTHQEDPWKKTPKDEVIDKQLIKQYYSQQPFAKNFPLEEGKPYYPVYSDFMYSFIFDFNEDDKAKEVIFDSFDEYKKMMAQSSRELKEALSFEPA
jgi:uncharacterized phage-associated protein